MTKLVNTTYKKEDVIILLQDLENKVPILDTKEREKLNQSGVHYSEMLPLEYKPTEEYMKIYNETLNELSEYTSVALSILAEKIYKKQKENITIVSLARAGTPIGILLKRYFKYKYNIDTPHYSVSIIRGKGIDKKAINTILEKHSPDSIVFLDGWVGKGAINKVLKESLVDYPEINSELAVLSDPACETQLYGTRKDFLISSACLNATVSGLISRTVKLKDMTDEEYHGAVYYEHLLNEDESYRFIENVEKYFNNTNKKLIPSEYEKDENFKGIDEVKEIAKEYNIEDINKVKPGVGETTRVLLRRVPDRVIVNKNTTEKEHLKHIYQLANDKNVPIEYRELKKYNVIGIIKDVADL